VKTVLPYLYNADVSTVPLFFESGTRFKILEAGACGIPVVSTTLGAEGIPATHGKDILIADSPTDFAESIIKLINDKVLSQEIAHNLQTLVQDKFSIASLQVEADQKIRALK
jgi:glycosyltransferase involved in cell wall biosynthesis